MQGIVFQNPAEEQLTLPDVVERIKQFIDRDHSAFYSLTIGTDSETRSSNGTEELVIITAIVIYRIGYGGIYFWVKRTTKPPKSIRDKIYLEVLQSVEIAKVLVPHLRSRLNGLSDRYELEIHIDVGEHGKTREMIREVTGIVTGYGYTARTKPYSYAASNIADKLI